MFEAVVIGASAGGLKALSEIIPKLPKNFPVPVIIVQHLPANYDSYMVEHLNRLSKITVLEVSDKQMLNSGTVYIAPSGYHVLVEINRTLSLNSDEKVNYSRPSIDVLFESAADAYQKNVIAIILTGANADGADGVSHIKQRGGKVIVQDPETAEVPYMPNAALKKCKADYIAPLNTISTVLCQILTENIF